MKRFVDIVRRKYLIGEVMSKISHPAVHLMLTNHETYQHNINQHRPNSIQKMSPSVMSSESDSVEFEFHVAKSLRNLSRQKLDWNVFLNPKVGPPPHDTLQHAYLLKFTQIQVPHVEKPLEHVHHSKARFNVFFTSEVETNHVTPSDGVYN